MKFKLSFSNIAWNQEYDDHMYSFLAKNKFAGIEIAPTRILPDNPYDRLEEARSFAKNLKSRFGLSISSMQSIWHGRSENLFANYQSYVSLAEYTKKAIDFAAAINCHNIVFGSPKNRNIPNHIQYEEAMKTARSFLEEICEYARIRDVVIALEPNPQIYGTNFINDITAAADFTKEVDGLSINVDLGAIIENDESLHLLTDNLHSVNHVHISEPNLTEIKKRQLHEELCILLQEGDYQGFVSIEMKNPGDINIVQQTAIYIREVYS